MIFSVEFKSVNLLKFINIKRLWIFTTNGRYRVQNFELHLILKNCYKNNRFLEF